MNPGSIKTSLITSTRQAARLGLIAICLSFTATALGASFEFNDKDRVAIIGNALADRLQHDGWTETLIQSRFPNEELVFRNLGFTGDTVSKRPRNRGFTSPEDYLKLVEPDIIFVFFGYNESYAGEAGVSDFKRELAEMIDRYRSLKPNGRDEPRFVLFSPTAHEDLQDPDLPNAGPNNERLSLYAAAIREVANEKSEQFVDLFNTSRSLFESHEEPLTINGVHLNETGNRLIAEVIAEALLGQRVSASPDLEPLREAVVDKNWHWFNRYRATDGNDIWGGRSGLKFVDGQTNRDVLEHELAMFDVMTANRDAQIWARANGRDLNVDDSNVPPPVKVISNVGGGSPSSNAMKEGSLEYFSGQAGIAKMTVPDGFEVNLFADEAMFPEVVNPVQMNVDPQGRLWVAAWQTYPKWEPLKEMNDRLLILPDDDGDGVADRAVTFAKVHNPMGFEFWNGGVLVASQPEILFLKDTDGDDVADVRIVYLQGLGSADTHHAANQFIYGPDGAIYYQSGIFFHNNLEHPWGPSLSTGASGMYRFDPRRFTITFHATNNPNPHGISFDYWGYHFATDGTGGRAYQVVPDGTGFTMRKLLNQQVRPVAANEIVSSANFPHDLQQNFLICNTIGFLGIKQYELNRDPETGHAWGEPVEDLLVSADRNFRPTDAVFGADGALYIADWHNVIIGHMQHNVRDPNRDHAHGRVYRMVYKHRPLQAPVKIADQPIPHLLAALEHPIDGIRYRARVELSRHDSGSVIAACEKWMSQFDASNPDHAHHLLEALWIHQRRNVRNPELLTALLGSPEPHARIAAGTVQHHWYVADPTRSGDSAPAEDVVAETKKSGVLSRDGDQIEVRIATVVEKLQFDVKSFSVQAGKKIKLTFVNPDFMPHNIVFVEPGAADSVGLAAMQLGAKGFELGWIPPGDKILVASKLLNHGAEQLLEFTAPSEPGEYQFVCTFPGHHLLMRGVMQVTE